MRSRPQLPHPNSGFDSRIIRGSHNILGSIVLTAAERGSCRTQTPCFLAVTPATESNCVHPQLQAEPETLDSLNKLGIKPASAESAFRAFASRLLGIPKYERRVTSNEEWHEFWRLARYVDQKEAKKIINESTHRGENWRDKLCARTISGKWRSLFQTLLPGPIVPADGSRDRDVSIDVQYHESELPSLRNSAPSLRHAPGTNYPLPKSSIYKALQNSVSRACQEGYWAAVLRMICSGLRSLRPADRWICWSCSQKRPRPNTHGPARPR